MSVKVKVKLVTPPEAVIVKVYSAKKRGSILSRTTNFADMKSYSGGPRVAVAVVAGVLAKELCLRFGDNISEEIMAKAAVDAFDEALMRGERQGFNKKRMEVDEDTYITVDHSEGNQET